MRLVVLACVLLASHVAIAGDAVCELGDPKEIVRRLEKYAAGKHWAEIDSRCFTEVGTDPDWRVDGKLRARVVAACTKAVALPTKQLASDPDGYCVSVLLMAGTAKVGDRDLVGELIVPTKDSDLNRDVGPVRLFMDEPLYEALAATGDPRVRPFVVSEFTRFRDAWKKRKHGRIWDTYTALERHEIAILHALAKVGTAADTALIDEIDAEHPKVAKWQKLTKQTREAIAKRGP